VTIPLHTAPGHELPDLVWHHDEAHDAEQIVARFRPPLFDGWSCKPDGGLWAAVLRDYTGPYRSDWGVFSREAGLRVKARYTSRITPHPDARFVVVDSQADAVALAQAFPGVKGQSTLDRLMGEQGVTTGPPPGDAVLADVPEYLRDALLTMGGEYTWPVADLTRLATHQYAGLWLTDRGRVECRDIAGLPEGVPSFWGWDVETVWFRTPELRVQETSRWEPV
jgi:hypothetical protein